MSITIEDVRASGPLITALIVGGLALLGIGYKAYRDDRQKRNDSLASLNERQISILSDLIAASYRFEHYFIQMRLIVTRLEGFEKLGNKADQMKSRDELIAHLPSMLDIQTSMFSIADNYGSLPHETIMITPHLAEYVEEWAAQMIDIDDSEEHSASHKAKAQAELRHDLVVSSRSEEV